MRLVRKEILSDVRFSAGEAQAGHPKIRVLKKFIQSWAINTLAVLVAVYIVPGIHYHQALDLLVASLLLGILNAVLRPLLLIVALPLVILTLGFFLLIINALLLYFVSFVLHPHFYVDRFSSAFWGALIISIVSVILNSITGTGSTRVKVERKGRSSSGSDDDDDVIDV
jgi:putative membrane protein